MDTDLMGMPIPPAFNSKIISLLDRGFVYAICTY